MEAYRNHQAMYEYNELHHLKQISENTRGKSGFMIIVSGVDSRIETTYEQPIKLDSKRKYELAFLNLETYYSFPNIDETNNKLQYKTEATAEWQDIEIPKGCYEIKAINKEIETQVKKSKDTDCPIKVIDNPNTLRCMLIIKGAYEVNFDTPNSLRTVLGFNASVYKKGTHPGEHSVNILRINSILVHTDIITSTYQNGRMEPIIYSFFPNVSPGEKIVAVQKNLIYVPITRDTIYRMTTWLTDQNNNKLDLQGETLTVRFHLREC